MSKSGYHVVVSAFVPFDPKDLKNIAEQMKALEHLEEGHVIDSPQLTALGYAVVKKVTFMQTIPKHMAEAISLSKDDAEPQADKEK